MPFGTYGYFGVGTNYFSNTSTGVLKVVNSPGPKGTLLIIQ